MLLSCQHTVANFGDRRIEGSACVLMSCSLMIFEYNQQIANFKGKGLSALICYVYDKDKFKINNKNMPN